MQLATTQFSYQKTVDQTEGYYLRASDPVYAFVVDCCELDSDVVTSKDILFEAFKDYCKAKKIPLINRDSFHKALRNSPYFKVTLTRPTVDGERVQSWRGIKVLNPVNPINPPEINLNLGGERVNKGIVNKSIEKRVDQSDRVDTGSPSLPGTDNGLSLSQGLGASVEEVLAIWDQEGRPLLHLGPGENYDDLAKLLAQRDIKPKHLSAIKEWLEKYLERR